MPIKITYDCDICGETATAPDGWDIEPPEGPDLGHVHVLCNTAPCLEHRAALSAHASARREARREAQENARAEVAERIAARIAAWERANPEPKLAR